VILESVIAKSYGALKDDELDGLARGLNVVFGRNEAGKTTYVSLVRDVLYGFPASGKAKERYTPADESAKSGALVFTESGSEWRIDRTHTAKTSGRDAVVTEAGGSAQRPGLVTELTHGVSEEMFRDVLGFGLDELATVGGLRDEGLRASLFSAGAGLGRVDMAKIRDELVKAERAELGGRRGSSARADRAAAELARVDSEIAEVRRAQASLEEERGRLAELEGHLAGLERERLEAEARLGRLESLSGGLKTLTGARRQRAERIAEAERELETVEEGLAGLAPPEDVLAAAHAIEVLRDEVAVFEREADAARTLVAESEAARAEAARLAQSLGQDWPADRCVAVPSGIGVEDGVEEYRERFGRAALRTEQAEGAATDARVELDAARGSVETETPGAGAGWWPAAAAGAIAVLAAALSIALEQWVGLALAALVAGLAVLLAVTARRAAGATTVAPDVGQAQARAEAADRAATDAAGQQEALRSEWRSWCRERGLPDGIDDPQTMARLLRVCADVGARTGAAEDARGRAEAAQRAVDSFAARVRELDVAGPQLSEDASPEATAEYVRSLVARLEAARETQAARGALEKDRDGLRTELDRARAQDREDDEEESAQRAEIASLVEQAGLPAELAEAGLDAIVERAREVAAGAREAHGALVVERTELVERLRQAEQAERTEELMQERELHLRELADAVERYTVYRLAQRLLDEAQRRNEVERQPAVVRRAAELFREITDGRYVDVVARVGEDDVQVVEAGGGRKTPDELSRGAKEQLYLAVRLAFIEALTQTGCDLPLIIDDAMGNFDDERMANVATALARVAESRQVIVFTCHDSTVAAFRHAAPGCNLVTLERS
jgi:uncharacterized protein YhaN